MRLNFSVSPLADTFCILVIYYLFVIWAIIPVVVVALTLAWNISNPPVQSVSSSAIPTNPHASSSKQTPPDLATKNTAAVKSEASQATTKSANPTTTPSKKDLVQKPEVAMTQAGKKGITGTDNVQALGQKYLTAWRSEKSTPELRSNALKNLGTVYAAANNQDEILAELFKVSKQNGVANTAYATAAEHSLKQIRTQNPTVAAKITFFSKHLITEPAAK